MSKRNRNTKQSKSPFSALRGLSVSTPPPPSPATAPKPEPVHESLAPEDLFAQEMSRLGVRPSTGKKPPAQQPAEKEPIKVEDLKLFLDALGEMETLFTDEKADESEAVTPVSRLDREAQGGRVAPEDVLDLHGYSRAEALTKVAWFVDNARYRGCRYLLIITGRGRQSGEAILRAAVEEWLRGAGAKEVREWCRAPARLGGEGALLVALKKRS